MSAKKSSSKKPATAPSADAGGAMYKLSIPKPRDEILKVKIRGITPLIVHAWNTKSLQQLVDKSSLSSEEIKMMQTPDWKFENSKYVSTDGWEGVHAAGFKQALIEALPAAGIAKEKFPQTLGKISIFIVADGEGKTFHEPLVRITGKPEKFENFCRVSNGTVYPNCRAMYRDWSATLTVRYNGIVLNRQMVLNLITFAGYYVGICEHRPSSPESKTGDKGLWEVPAQEAS